MNDYIPDGFEWIKGKGLMKSKGTKSLKVSNAIPIVLQQQKRTYFGKNNSDLYIKLQYIDCNDKILEDENKENEFLESDIKSGTFIKKAPMSVIIEPNFIRNISSVYQCIIKKQLSEINVIEKVYYTFGWNGRKYYWGDKTDIKLQEYTTAARLARILNEENHVIIALVLAAIHGPMKTILSQIGIYHDFVTFIVGESGIGKTELTRIFCDYIPKKELLFHLGSDRKEIKKKIEDSKDITIVIDDFNQSNSNRVKERILQILSEIIQSASDSGKILIDGDSKDKEHYENHIVSTGESIVHNISTLNRCYIVFMMEEISEELRKNILAFERDNLMWSFMRYFIQFVENNYERVMEHCKANYSYYQDMLNKEQTIHDSSRNRINNTLAVQLTIKKTLMDYLKHVNIDPKLRNNINDCMDTAIRSCGQALECTIQDISNKKKKMEFLPTLSEIIEKDFLGDMTTKSEKKYMRGIKYSTQKQYIGICIHRGYISFNPKHMCKLIEKELKKPVSALALGKELSYYSLARVDTEGKISCRWGTENRMYHVRYRELRECTYDYVFSISGSYDDYERHIGLFEMNHGWGL